MNAMLASGGYSWTAIRVEDRAADMAALETASVDMDIRAFAAFIGERVRLPRSATEPAILTAQNSQTLCGNIPFERSALVMRAIMGR